MGHWLDEWFERLPPLPPVPKFVPGDLLVFHRDRKVLHTIVQDACSSEDGPSMLHVTATPDPDGWAEDPR